MGVAVIGLLGIASLIPLSSKNAADSMYMSEAQALSTDWYSEFNPRGLNVSGNWIMYRDFSTPARQNFDKQLGSTLSSRGCTPAPTYLLRELGRESICLDPYFLAHSSFSNTQSNWYRPAVFPYYQDTYNPLIDSAYPVASVGSSFWEAQPRMVRVTVPGDSGGPLSMRSLERTFLSTDDLTITRDVPALNVDDKDETVPPMRYGLSNARFASTNHYSWFATMSPAEPIPALSTESTIFYTVSLVVVHDRDLQVFDPAVTAMRTGINDPPRVDDKPKGERLLWVEPISGDFVGGNGGRVRLIGNDGTDSDVKSGDWVMLSRTYAASLVSASPITVRPFTVFRWYRIISVEQEQTPTLLSTPPLPYQLGTLTQVTNSATVGDPYNIASSSLPNQVWGREVVLEGPDWSFGPGINPISPIVSVSGAGSGGLNIVTPTTATLVKGVKTVIERVMTIY